MKQSLFHKRIPTLFGIVLIVGCVLTTAAIVKGGFTNILHAAPTAVPNDVQITNIMPTSFSVTYTTQDSVPGTISYSLDTAFDQVAFDDRDTGNKTPASYTVHHITIKNLKASTTYNFRITSGGDTYLNNNTPYTATTATTVTPLKNTKVVSGSVTTSDGTSPQAIVYVATDTSQTLSTLVQSDGTYTVPLDGLRTKNLLQYVALDDATPLTIIVRDNGTSSKASVTVSSASKVPLITLSENFDFSQSSPLDEEQSGSSSAEPFPTRTGQPQKEAGPQILSPQKGSALKDPQPDFKGIGVPNETVDIVIHSADTITATVTTDKTGNWHFRPTTPLSPGSHIISITTRDALGVLRTITQSFVVNAQGSQFVDPSVSPTKTPTSTPTQAPITTATPTPVPTNQPTPTVTPTIAPTPIQQPTITPTPAPLQKLESGSDIVQSGMIAAFATLFFGSVLIFLTRKRLV